MSKRFPVLAALVLLCALLLCACGRAAEEPQETKPAEYRVRYYDGKKLLRELKVTEGECPADFTPALEGRRFLGWQDQKGESAQPAALPVTKNVNYRVFALPLFGTHAPYLFPDDEGWIRASSPLSADDFAAAVTALCPEGTTPGKLPNGAEPLAAEELRQVLERFYLPEELAAFPAEGTLSRADFARAMNALLGRGGDETLLAAPTARAPADLSAWEEGYADLMEACIPHETASDGARWEETALSTGLKPGLLYADGRHRVVGEDGRFVRSAENNTLFYDENGYYTSGDAELDALVTAQLQALGREFPKDAADRMAMLRHYYDYVIGHYRFVGRNSHTDDPGWEARDGKLMLESGRGDCYNYAGAFTMVARGLGYPAVGIIRSLDDPENLHAWTDIVLDGKAYVFDPQLAQKNSNSRFKLPYDFAWPTYGYVRPLGVGQYSEDDFDELVWAEPTEHGSVRSVRLYVGGSMLVYLPADYDGTTPCNVLLCLNGEGDARALLGSGRDNAHRSAALHTALTGPDYLDYLIQRGDCANVIVAAVSTADDKDGEKTPRRVRAALETLAENYATYAEGSDSEALAAAREHFALAGTESARKHLWAAVRAMPEAFGSYLIASEPDEQGEGLGALTGSGEIDTLIVAYGTMDRKGRDIKAAYETLAKAENVGECLLLTGKGSGANDWTLYDNALRELLMRFAPGQAPAA